MPITNAGAEVAARRWNAAKLSKKRLSTVLESLRRVVSWYAKQTRPAVPFYCDAGQVGAFSVPLEALSSGDNSALFQLFITLSMYQARRDVLVMAHQRAVPASRLKTITGLTGLGAAIRANPCKALGLGDFESDCDVYKDRSLGDCGKRPGLYCHVKEATQVFKRTGDMGKLPTSAWLNLWKDGVRPILADVLSVSSSPLERASLLVERFTRVHRVGRKLATMYVSALSTPAIAPGLTPWFPQVDGNNLVVIDTNVARAISVLRGRGTPSTYEAGERWIGEQANMIDLQVFDKGLPKVSARFIQEALYAFGSKSNRTARNDPCKELATQCQSCVLSLCPFMRRKSE